MVYCHGLVPLNLFLCKNAAWLSSPYLQPLSFTTQGSTYFLLHSGCAVAREALEDSMNPNFLWFAFIPRALLHLRDFVIFLKMFQLVISWFPWIDRIVMLLVELWACFATWFFNLDFSAAHNSYSLIELLLMMSWHIVFDFFFILFLEKYTVFGSEGETVRQEGLYWFLHCKL